MKKLLGMVLMLGLLATGASAQAGMSGNCSPEGTWYGYNAEGAIWIVTITRSGPSSFTTVMDWAPNHIVIDPPFILASSDWRGEFVKTGSRSYDWTTMALWRIDEAAGFPLGLGFCPLTAQFTSCDSFQGEGTCSYYGYFNHDDDPFVDGIPVGSGDPLQASFKRMPMSYPE